MSQNTNDIIATDQMPGRSIKGPIKQDISVGFQYPAIDLDDSSVERLFDREVADPYKALEERYNWRVDGYVKKQNQVTKTYLSKCPHRSIIRQILKKDEDYHKYCRVSKVGKHYYFMMKQNNRCQSLYHQETIDGAFRPLNYQKKWCKRETGVMNHAFFSPNGQYLAFGVNSFKEWHYIYIRNMLTGELLPETLARPQYKVITWTHDNKGFFYTRCKPRCETDYKMYYHLLNTPQSEDKLMLEFPDHPDLRIFLRILDDGKHLYVYVRKSRGYMLYYCDLTQFNVNVGLTLRTIYDKDMLHLFHVIGNNGDTVFVRTSLGADNYRIAKFDLRNPSSDNWEDVIPNHPDKKIMRDANLYTFNGVDYIVVTYEQRLLCYLELHTLDGGGVAIKEFRTPQLANGIELYRGRRDDGEFFFQLISFLTPGDTYRFDFRKGLHLEPELFHQYKPAHFEPSDYNIEQVFFKSKDNTCEVPMFIIHRKDLVRDGSTPCILQPYDTLVDTPNQELKLDLMVWLRNFRGMLAVAIVRGSDRLDVEWLDSGSQLNLKNAFDDFIAAAEYLIDNKYTRPTRLAIEGTEIGGTLVAVCANQRPDLFGAIVSHRGILDMIKFDKSTVYIGDFGDPDEREHFENLIKYSPYHNIPAQVDRYPATLLLTSNRKFKEVDPWHSYKFMANLQQRLGNRVKDTPLLLRVHFHSKLTRKEKIVSGFLDRYADIYSFLYNALDLEQCYSGDCWTG